MKPYQANEEVLARVHERLGGLGVNIATFGATGTVEVRWRRSYAGKWSDERYLEAQDLPGALQGILEYEDQADQRDNEEETP